MRRLALALSVVTTLSPLAGAQAQVRLPALGESAAEDLSVGSERRLGDTIMRDIRRDPDYLDDPVLQEYLQSLWSPLVAAARQRGDVEPDVDRQFAWEMFIVRDRTVNAFALPGGFVGVHLGLIALTASSDELASVLAHELSHVTQRHIARSVGNSQRASMLGLAAIILGILAASRSNNADIANAAITGGQAAAIQGQLNFSRDMEREADRMGYGVLSSAGFATGGMAAMFDKLETANRINDNGSFPYLRSHPLTVERIAEARSRTLLPGSTAAGSTVLHTLMQARARILMDTDPQLLRRAAEPLAAPNAGPARERLPLLYGGVLAAALLGDHAKADAGLNRALALVSQFSPAEPQAERELRLLQAQIQMIRGEPAQALQTLDTLALDAGGRAPMLLRSQAAVEAHRRSKGATAELQQSMDSLQIWVADHRNDAAAWSQLSATAEALGLRLRAMRALAESRAALGDLGGAIDRLRAGQQLARSATGQDFIEASVIDARMRELTRERRQIALDARGNRSPREDEPPPQ